MQQQPGHQHQNQNSAQVPLSSQVLSQDIATKQDAQPLRSGKEASILSILEKLGKTMQIILGVNLGIKLVDPG